MMDDAPPPPYSETDVYSRSGRAPAARTGANDDDASVDASSSHSTTIYTPPETPRESHHNFSGGDDHHTVASAHSYFESRPALTKRASGYNFVISLEVTEDASPDDFPYPGWASAHDTTEQDWQTFLNYLLPDHASRANSQILERKLRAEKDAQSSPTGKSIAEAQLNQIKSSSDLPSQPLHDIDAMIHEWNDGFFGPRGVTIQRAQAPASRHLPTVDPEPQPQSQSQEQGQTNRPRWNPFRPFVANSGGLRIGRLAIDGDRVSFGDSFEVDRNGVRWNGSSAEDPRFNHHHGVRGDIPRGPGPFDSFQEGRGRCFDDQGIGRGRGGRWWKAGHNHHHYGPRDHSPSSHSSASSSGSSSASSIGSLPDWDDLRDNQLPVTKQSISAWLAHPEQPVTREMLKATRSNIKAAKNAPPPANDPAWDVSREAMRQEVRALLARFKELKREQKKSLRAVRRERKEQRRAVKRERKERRRAEKRERRSHERDFRQAELEIGGHARRRASFDPFNNPFAGPMHGIPRPHHPNPHIPSVPGVPGPHPAGAPGFFGGAGFFGGGMRGGPFGGNRPWEAHVQHAKQQAELARAHGLEQAELARAQADSSRSLAQAQAELARMEAQRVSEASRAHADRARADAQRTADSARAQAEEYEAAAAATAAMWRSGPFSYASAYTQPQPQSTGTTTAVGSGNNNLDNNRHKYETADALEAQILVKASKLLTLRGTIELEQMEAAKRGEGDAKEKSKTQAQQEAEGLEREIENLGKDVERLRLEADEELARKMAEEEHLLG
ncbi:hypothetical protein F5Y13DRAFT_172595 [Hypoxylon sp. FL1857]|nr:hypothetical protein F5Y13DRAFT_172595 [Hypoxylon sp. FL1857]